MFTHIRVQNFKSWKDSGKVELAPLTGFFGTNSSGKSSLLQMLLLLKQTAERPDVEEVIFFGDENSFVNLGDFHEVVHGHKAEKQLELEFGSTLKEPLEIRLFPKPNSRDNRSILLGSSNSLNFRSAIRAKEGKLNIEDLRYQGSQYTLEKVPYSNDISLSGYQIGKITNVKNCYGMPLSGQSRFVQSVQQFSSAFENLFAHVYYLGPTRVSPKRHYRWERSHPENIGQSGEDMIDSLLSARVDQIRTPYKGKNVPIEERISAWIQEMELAYSFSLDRIGTQGNWNYEIRIQKSPDNAKVTLVDMGYGLAQFLPVLVHCYYAPEGSTLILEQPGMHLHPKVQSQLADLLIEVVTERSLQILVESHSEHLLTRLQLRIAEQQIAAKDTALYFCENDNGVSNIKPLDVDELGNIKNWPKNFFGNVRGDLVKMAREQMKRQKKAED